MCAIFFFFFSSRRRHTRYIGDWSSDVCSSDLGTLIYGPTVMAVKGNYDQVNRLCSEVANTHGWGFVNINLRPYYSEGSKTLGYEVAEQLGWQLPDHVVAPLASGSLFTKIHKGFQEFVKVGLVDDKPVRFSGAQAEGC